MLRDAVYTTAAEGDGARRHAGHRTIGPGRCFKGRATLLKRALEYVSARAFAYTEPEPALTASAPARLEEILLREFQDSPIKPNRSANCFCVRPAAMRANQGFR